MDTVQNHNIINVGKDLWDVQPPTQISIHKTMLLSTTSACFWNASRDSDSNYFSGQPIPMPTLSEKTFQPRLPTVQLFPVALSHSGENSRTQTAVIFLLWRLGGKRMKRSSTHQQGQASLRASSWHRVPHRQTHTTATMLWDPSTWSSTGIPAPNPGIQCRKKEHLWSNSRQAEGSL